jgi:hypothetical protein
MTSSTMWACGVLSPSTLHSDNGMVRCRRITRPVAVADRGPTTLASGCSRTVTQCY